MRLRKERKEMSREKFVPSERQLEALKKWAEAHGRTWKNELRAAWMTGNYGRLRYTDETSYLQQVRNQGGPSWLHKFKLSEENQSG
jgi:hypothetical protein